MEKIDVLIIISLLLHILVCGVTADEKSNLSDSYQFLTISGVSNYNFNGIPFFISTLGSPPLLNSRDSPTLNLHNSENIKGIHIIELAGYAESKKDGDIIGVLIIHYLDNSISTINLIIGENIAEWAYDRSELQGTIKQTKIQSAYDFSTTIDSGRAYTGHYFYLYVDTANKPVDYLELLPQSSRVVIEIRGITLESSSGFSKKSTDAVTSGIIRNQITTQVREPTLVSTSISNYYSPNSPNNNTEYPSIFTPKYILVPLAIIIICLLFYYLKSKIKNKNEKERKIIENNIQDSNQSILTTLDISSNPPIHGLIDKNNRHFNYNNMILAAIACFIIAFILGIAGGGSSLEGVIIFSIINAIFGVLGAATKNPLKGAIVGGIVSIVFSVIFSIIFLTSFGIEFMIIVIIGYFIPGLINGAIGGFIAKET